MKMEKTNMIKCKVLNWTVNNGCFSIDEMALNPSHFKNIKEDEWGSINKKQLLVDLSLSELPKICVVRLFDTAEPVYIMSSLDDLLENMNNSYINAVADTNLYKKPKKKSNKKVLLKG
jgi:hypothetical protein